MMENFKFEASALHRAPGGQNLQASFIGLKITNNKKKHTKNKERTDPMAHTWLLYPSCKYGFSNSAIVIRS